MGKFTIEDYPEIDPVYLILKGKAYIIWCEINHPHTPAKESGIKKFLEQISLEEKKDIIGRAKASVKFGEKLIKYSNAIINAAKR
jgi:hypothetical protein